MREELAAMLELDAYLDDQAIPDPREEGMTFDEAEAHLGNPVLIRTAPGRATNAEIVAVNRERRMVGLRVRYVVLAQGWRPGIQWWHPCHLDIPRWWTARQEAA